MEPHDILCEAPGPGGLTCTLPYGHDVQEGHAWSVMLPPDVAKMVSAIMADLEWRSALTKKAIFHARVALAVAIMLIVIYLTLIIVEIFT